MYTVGCLLKIMTIISLPSPHEVKTLLPIRGGAKAFVEESRTVAKRIVLGKVPRKALVIGPCSIHDRLSAIEYAERFKHLAEQVSRTCFLVMRVYMEKSRTSTGWKGLLYDPHLDGSHDIKTGLLWTRELLLLLAEMRIPCATEFVDPLAAPYFEDLTTWGFIGARTASSQPHRQYASSLPIPVGFKNSTDGNIDNAVHGVLSSRQPHTSMHSDEHGRLCALQSEGNPFSHIVLRGGHDFTNYDSASVYAALEKLKHAHLPQRLMIDCSHGNRQNHFDGQQEVFLSVLEQIEKGNDKIFGLMLESHLESGSQPLTEDPALLKYAISITDPCLDWKTTEELVHSADEAFSSGLVGVS
ncbi:MAG: 3-deoxy-7-phosphoheptulonate synthase [Candidatus Melainabacteria bacterium]|nr:3-deoxy-7-phosphoheptulonate synthase [Candidatus Melainabacteria bacterium]